MTLPFKKYLVPKNYLNYFRYVFSNHAKHSWAQQGEDLLIDLALRTLNLKRLPNYLDIGANHPIRGNNTYYFYRRGARGVCIEPDPELFTLLQQKRPKDVVLNVGIGTTDETAAAYYAMTSKSLSTFKKGEAEQYVAQGKFGLQKIEKVLQIRLRQVNAIAAEYFPDGIDILSLDTEGFDIDILRSLDFAKHAPKVICVETLRYDQDGSLRKVTEIEDLLKAHGYSVFADTHVNTILVKF